jgi:hypothetical protein
MASSVQAAVLLSSVKLGNLVVLLAVTRSLGLREKRDHPDRI